MRLSLFAALLVSARTCGARGQQVDEFQVYSPSSFQQMTLDYFLERHKADPTETMEANSPLMLRAKAHAVRRLVMRADDELAIRDALAFGADGATSGSITAANNNSDTSSGGSTGNALLRLPASPSKDGILSTSLTAETGRDLVSAAATHASALLFNEQVGSGAISQAGALLPGTSGQWLLYAEDKLKRDAGLTHHGLLWELGAELHEAQQAYHGGVNVSLEENLLGGLGDWFRAGGGKLHFVAPVVTQSGLSLVASEAIAEDETIVSMPFRLVMCRQTARNVLIGKTGRYLGEELTKAFERNEHWGLAILLLHEYHKEMNGAGSKWGPYLRSLRMRYLSTDAVQALRGTQAAALQAEWLNAGDKLLWWSVGSEGPCVPTMRVCTTKPLDKHGDTRYTLHQMRWALWVVKQNAVRVRQVSTGLHFLALVPYFGMIHKDAVPAAEAEKGTAGGAGTVGSAGAEASGVCFELDGSVTIRAATAAAASTAVSASPGAFTDAEFFLRYLSTPRDNAHNYIHLKLPGAIPKGSKFHYCLKGTKKERNSDECRGTYRSEAMFWKSKVLTEWRKVMNLPPRMQELRMWAHRLHLYGTSPEEARLLSAANHMIAGLPLSVEDMPPEEQLMLMGVAQSSNEAAAMVSGGESPRPQLYSAPDPKEDSEAQRAMEELAFLAAQAQSAIRHAPSSGSNATEAVLNRTRDFFQHGILPMAGLDELDDFLLKKIGMIAHCGFENDMKIAGGNVSAELMCAMRVHLMNETEIEVFCPASARAWQDNCHDVQFLNFTAISQSNEEAVIRTFGASIESLLASYPTTMAEDEALLRHAGGGGEDGEGDEGAEGGGSAGSEEGSGMGAVMRSAVTLRLREKALLHSAMAFLSGHAERLAAGLVPFQLEGKALEREALQRQQDEYAAYLEALKVAAEEAPFLASISVDFGGDKRLNLTLAEGQDLQQVVRAFCDLHALPASNIPNLAAALQKRVPSPPPLLLMMGVVVPTGHRRVLGVHEGSNVTIETGAFCLRHNVSQSLCEGLQTRVAQRLDPYPRFARTVLLSLPVDAPDSRTVRLLVRQGEQHDLRQLATDFLEFYRMPPQNADMLAQEAHKRLPAVALSVPVSLQARRQVAVRFSLDDNITAVVEGFASVFDAEEMKVAILKRARFGMSPGSFLV